MDFNNSLRGIGANDYGQLGDGTSVSKSRIIDVFTNVTNITSFAYTSGTSLIQNSFALKATLHHLVICMVLDRQVLHTHNLGLQPLKRLPFWSREMF
jgi:hypothetical protein